MRARSDQSSQRLYESVDGRVLQVFRNRTDRGGIVTSIIDITDLKRQAADLAAARDVAEAATRAKSAFLANMSHELRTPLNGVVGLADLLSREDLTPRQADMVSIIRSSGAALQRLVSDLLDVAHVEAGAAAIKYASFDLVACVRGVCVEFAATAHGKGLDFSVEVPAALEVVGDQDRIIQILSNLLSNAIKFTAAGEVRVGLTSRQQGVRILVADTGIGFDPMDKERLFRRFEQGDDSVTRRFGGTGVGLAISRDLAQRMGGGLDASARQGGGSTFVLDLPLAVGETVEGAVSKAAAASPTLSAPRVLVVDDNKINQRVLCLMLDVVGVQVHLAADGQEAVDLWRTEAFDVILMDIQMPRMDGFTAVRTIRAIEAETDRPPTAIVMVSANASPEHVAASYAAGAQGHLAKPVTAKALFGALDALGGAASEADDSAAA